MTGRLEGAGPVMAPYLGGPENATPSIIIPKGRCEQPRDVYEIVPAVICGMCFVFGILYTFFGYRFFKAVMFLTGFIFGSVVTYMICVEKNVLPTEGNAGIALGAGVLCGLVTMLVQYVGLFLTGIHLGALVSVAGLVILEQFYHPESKWISFGSLFLVGVLCALLTLYFQKGLTIVGTAVFGAALMTKGLTIVGTAVFGAALMTVCLDYFLDSFMMVLYCLDRIKVVPSPDQVCWYSWILLGCWPLGTVFGVFLQWRFTGRGVDHQEALHSQRRRKVQAAAAAREAQLAADRAAEEKALQKAREKAAQQAREKTPPKQVVSSSTNESAAPPDSTTPLTPVEPSTRYRQLYQVRRCNGDIISQSFIKSVEHQLSPVMKNMISASEQVTRCQTTYTQINETT